MRANQDKGRLPVRLLLIPVVLVLAGCSNPAAESTAAKLQKIGNLYGPYCLAHGLRGPASEAEFRSYIRTCPSLQLQTLAINTDDLDPLFKSDRDQQPFIFRYGLVLAGADRKASRQVVAYEQKGGSGKRLALYSTGRVEMVDEESLQKLVQ
jgi:hypothetical protein